MFKLLQKQLQISGKGVYTKNYVTKSENISASDSTTLSRGSSLKLTKRSGYVTKDIKRHSHRWSALAVDSLGR